MSFWNSGLLKKLQDGELPEVKTSVSVAQKDIVNIAVALIIVAIVIILSTKLVSRL